jgi:hypothetical protein
VSEAVIEKDLLEIFEKLMEDAGLPLGDEGIAGSETVPENLLDEVLSHLTEYVDELSDNCNGTSLFSF